MTGSPASKSNLYVLIAVDCDVMVAAGSLCANRIRQDSLQAGRHDALISHGEVDETIVSRLCKQ